MAALFPSLGQVGAGRDLADQIAQYWSPFPTVDPRSQREWACGWSSNSQKDVLPLRTKQFMILPDSAPITPAELTYLCSLLLRGLCRRSWEHLRSIWTLWSPWPSPHYCGRSEFSGTVYDLVLIISSWELSLRDQSSDFACDMGPWAGYTSFLPHFS